MRDSLCLPTLFGINTRIRAGGINQTDYRPSKFFRVFHGADGLAISLRLGHPKVSESPLFCVPTLLLTNNKDFPLLVFGKSTDDCRVVRKPPVAM